MTPEQVLAIPPRVLTQAQREFYFSEGYILLEAIIGDEWVKKLRDATDEMVERSRKVTRSDPVFDLEPDHSAGRAAAAPGEQPDRAPSGVLGVREPLGAARRGGRPGRPERQVPPLQAQLQVEQGRRRGEVALRHLVLAAHQLLAAHRRHLHLRLRHGPGPARRDSAEPPDRADAHPVRRRRQVGGLPVAARRRRARPRQGGLSHRPGRLADPAQLPHHPRLAAQRLRPRPAAAALHADLGRRLPLHREPDQAGPRPDDHPRRARRVRAPRPAALPDPARLVARLHLDLLARSRRRRAAAR